MGEHDTGSHAPAAEPDFAALRSCWHPVGFAAEFADQPKRVRLLGEDLVVWRDSAGAAHVLRDLCIHRGTALSLGRVVEDQLMCPYHGWRYRARRPLHAHPAARGPVTGARQGARRRIPMPGSSYGLIWVAIDEPRWDLPELPELDSAGWTVVRTRAVLVERRRLAAA